LMLPNFVGTSEFPRNINGPVWRLPSQVNLVNGALANALLCDSALHSILHRQ